MGICSTYYGMFNRPERGLELRNKHGEIQRVENTRLLVSACLAKPWACSAFFPHSVCSVPVHTVLGTCVRATGKIQAGLASK